MRGFLNFVRKTVTDMSSAERGRRKAYANDLRWRMVYQRIGMRLPLQKIAENLNVSAATVYRVNVRFEQTGEVDPQDPHKRRPYLRQLDQHNEIYMVGLVLQNPTIYLSEVCSKIYDECGLQASPSTICRLLFSYGITHKKVGYVALQRCNSLRGAYMAQSFMFTTDKFVWIDETGTDARDQSRKYGYALRGQRPVVHHFHSRGRRVNAIAAISSSGLVTVELTQSTVDKEVFFNFVRSSLIPNMMVYDGSVAVMDNLSVHHAQEVLDLFHQAGVMVLFLPPYSPDLNPIEEAFSYVKSYLREHSHLLQALPYMYTQDIIKAAFHSITPELCRSWIYHSGYNTL